MLTTGVSDDHLAELRRDGISYMFAGADKLDLEELMRLLEKDFNIKRLLLLGGGSLKWFIHERWSR